jgi:hypothetical protein
MHAQQLAIIGADPHGRGIQQGELFQDGIGVVERCPPFGKDLIVLMAPAEVGPCVAAEDEFAVERLRANDGKLAAVGLRGLIDGVHRLDAFAVVKENARLVEGHRVRGIFEERRELFRQHELLAPPPS